LAQTSSFVHSSERRTLWAFNLTREHGYTNFCVVIGMKIITLLLFMLDLLFLLVWISHGKVVTRLRWRGKCNNLLIANFLLNLAVKKFRKWPAFVKVMPKTIVACFCTQTVKHTYMWFPWIFTFAEHCGCMRDCSVVMYVVVCKS